MKKTVLFINGHLDVGGCEKSLIDVLKNFDYTKYEVDLLLLEHMGDYLDDVPKEVNIKLYSLDDSFGGVWECLLNALRNKDWFALGFRIGYMFGKKINPYFMRFLKGLFKKLRMSYDVIIAYRPGICTELAAFTFDGKKKITWWHHGEMNLSLNDIKQLDKAYKKIDRVVTVSRGCRELLVKSFPDINNKLYIIPNMIDPNELFEKANEYNPNEFTADKLKIVSVGRMSHEKNMVLCSEIGRYLSNKGLDFVWVIIGDGEEEKNIKEQVKRYNLENKMVLIGRKMNPYPYIADADIMIHPSLVESQGITLVESMALYTPVIAVSSSGPREFIVTGENGYLANPEPEEIYSFIKMLQENVEIRKRIVENARDTVVGFEPSKITKKIQSVIEC